MHLDMERGLLVGIKIEEKLALGYMMVTVILPKTESMLAKQLRDLGYGVTVTYGYGREGERMILEVLTSRKMSVSCIVKYQKTSLKRL